MTVVEYKEYAFENGKEFDPAFLQASSPTDKQYSFLHQSLSIPCHDVAIEYNSGILLVVRDKYPAKNELWVIGGRIQRGMSTEASLKKKAKEECGLDIYDLTFLGCSRTSFLTDPFGHGRGTDTINWMYFARGQGKLKLDKFHKEPLIVKPKDCTLEFRKKLHPYVQDYLDECLKLLKKD